MGDSTKPYARSKTSSVRDDQSELASRLFANSSTISLDHPVVASSGSNIASGTPLRSSRTKSMASDVKDAAETRMAVSTRSFTSEGKVGIAASSRTSDHAQRVLGVRKRPIVTSDGEEGGEDCQRK